MNKLVNQYVRNKKGITLIALVITIIILLILAGVAISALGESGLFEKAKIARAKSEYASAKENIEMKLMEIQTDCMKNEKEYKIEEIAKNIKESKEITIEKYYNSDIASIKSEVTENLEDLSGLVVSVDKYSNYKFLISKNCKIAGATTKKITDVTGQEEFKTIEEFEKENFGTKIDKNENIEEEIKPVSLVPNMTSSTTPSGRVSASYENGQYKAYLAFSTLTASDGYSWSAWPNGAGSWIMYQFERPIKLKRIKLKSHDIYSNVENFTVYGSNNGVDFEKVYNGTHGNNADLEEFELSEYSNSYQYLKLVIDSVYNNVAVTFDKIEYYGIIVE